MELSFKQIEDFLLAVDQSFPVPLSKKQDLHILAQKFWEKATICARLDGNEIVTALFGYTDNVTDNIGYMSVLASLPKARGKGYAQAVVREFLDVAAKKGLSAAHLYTDRSNITAIGLYEKLGFVPYLIPDEPRPNDLHLIYYIKEGNSQ